MRPSKKNLPLYPRKKSKYNYRLRKLNKQAKRFNSRETSAKWRCESMDSIKTKTSCATERARSLISSQRSYGKNARNN